MPAEHPVPLEQTPQDQHPAQVKVCASCQSTLVDNTTSVFLPEVDAIVCTGCREHVLSARAGPIDARILCADISSSFTTQPLRQEGNAFQDTRRSPEPPLFDDDMVVDSPSQGDHPYHDSLVTPPKYSSKPTNLTVQCNTSDIPPEARHHSRILSSTTISRRQAYVASSPDPLTDITRIRVRSQGHHCLYPGATFEGTQKSGRNSYDVNVTIVDVDFSSSFLCGYLRIRGLTDDWPELTTYFDAEIIGSRYGFLTQNWGATEQEDMVHWGRFPAFRHVRSELKKPHMKIPDRDRGAVFMRWKERFLVPDHRVHDINGASFAGFYYICVDFNPPPASRSTSQSTPLTPDDEMDMSYSQAAIKPELSQRARRNSSVRPAGRRAPSASPRASTPIATMSGFYYHQNSEPYQQLSLSHVPEHASCSFEFR
ncbi:Glucose-induced degradation protein 4 [Hypsizygus marmoreus]|uniref:Glucose-induced degradation protein 4 n=1 Tax=Hypsizygus marmoreus TaxID=39966 RepID=A0A369JKT4_HYPMA|nr:Glucose-induced degradation protein 4 [Hypsizygus marmoreus]